VSFLTSSATLAVAPEDALTRSRAYSRHQEPAASAAGLPERAAAGCVGADAGVIVDVRDVLDVRFGTVVHRLAPDVPPCNRGSGAVLREVFLSGSQPQDDQALVALAVVDNRRAAADRLYVDVCMAPFEAMPKSLRALTLAPTLKL
jgi:hypothetical protein